MEKRTAFYRDLYFEAMIQAGYNNYLSPMLREVVLETADELYLERLEEMFDGTEFRIGRLARKWQPSLAA